MYLKQKHKKEIFYIIFNIYITDFSCSLCISKWVKLKIRHRFFICGISNAGHPCPNKVHQKVQLILQIKSDMFCIVLSYIYKKGSP